jgi:hypothetical protein
VTEPDRSERVIAAWRAPNWVHRVPPSAWAFVALAAANVALRLWLPGTRPSIGAPAIVVMSFVLGIAGSAAAVALPAAVLAGRTRGQPRRVLLAGAVAFAAIELVVLAWLVATSTRAGEGDVTAAGLDVPLRFAAAILGLVAPIALVVGARSAAGPATPSSARVRALVIAGVAISVLATAVLYAWLTPVARLGSPVDPVTILANALSLGVTSAWGVLAVIAAGARRQPDDSAVGWTVLAASAGLIFAGRVAVAAAALLGLFLRLDRPGSSSDAYLVAVQLGSAVEVGGQLLLLVALLVGPSVRSHQPAPSHGTISGDPQPA